MKKRIWNLLCLLLTLTLSFSVSANESIFDREFDEETKMEIVHSIKAMIKKHEKAKSMEEIISDMEDRFAKIEARIDDQKIKDAWRIQSQETLKWVRSFNDKDLFVLEEKVTLQEMMTAQYFFATQNFGVPMAEALYPFNPISWVIVAGTFSLDLVFLPFQLLVNGIEALL